MIFRTNEGPGMRRPSDEIIPQQQVYGDSVAGDPAPPMPPEVAAWYAANGHPPPMMQQQVVVSQKRGVNHGLHFVLTVFTFGLWLPVWILDAMFNS